MNVRITVASSGKAVGKGITHGIILKDVTSIEQVQEEFAKEFNSFFPVYQKLDQTPAKPKKDKKEEA